MDFYKNYRENNARNKLPKYFKRHTISFLVFIPLSLSLIASEVECELHNTWSYKYHLFSTFLYLVLICSLMILRIQQKPPTELHLPHPVHKHTRGSTHSYKAPTCTRQHTHL